MSGHCGSLVSDLEEGMLKKFDILVPSFFKNADDFEEEGRGAETLADAVSVVSVSCACSA